MSFSSLPITQKPYLWLIVYLVQPFDNLATPNKQRETRNRTQQKARVYTLQRALISRDSKPIDVPKLVNS